MGGGLGDIVDEFLRKQSQSEYWRAVEIQKQLEHADILDIKSVLEEGVRTGRFERIIVTKKKVSQVGYRIKLEKQTITKDDVGKVSDVLGEGWERKKR